MQKRRCTICGRIVEDDDELVECSICKAPMHRGCIDEEVLSDAEGNIMCPRCALQAAIDWVDHIITFYANSIRGEAGEEVKERLMNLVKLLES